MKADGFDAQGSLFATKNRNKACLSLQKPELVQPVGAFFIIQKPIYGPAAVKPSPAGQTGQPPPGSWFICNHH